MNETDALMVLNAVRGVGNVTIKKLVEHYKTAVNVLKTNIEELRTHCGLTQSQVKALSSFKIDEFLAFEHKLIKEHNIRVFSIFDNEYPDQLRNISDAPTLLYVKGQWPINFEQSIAMVGSRKASVYGLTTSQSMSARLAEYGIVTVSGMARGVDTAAHVGTLSVKGVTVAVLGCGLSNVYPPENGDLMNRIAQDGAVISEYPMSMPPVAHNFPRRNRIISGLSSGVVVVEAALKSGALITVDTALEQGREVYAVPGEIGKPTASGVNQLIKQGAKLITSVEDIVEDLKLQLVALKADEIVKNQNLNEDLCENLSQSEEALMMTLSGQARHLDEIVQESGVNISETMRTLMQLEMKRCVKQLPGKRYVKGTQWEKQKQSS